MSRPVLLTFSRSSIFMSSVAKGFKCFAAETAVARRCPRESLLAKEDGKAADGEFERLILEET